MGSQKQYQNIKIGPDTSLVTSRTREIGTLRSSLTNSGIHGSPKSKFGTQKHLKLKEV